MYSIISWICSGYLIYYWSYKTTTFSFSSVWFSTCISSVYYDSILLTFFFNGLEPRYSGTYFEYVVLAFSIFFSCTNTILLVLSRLFSTDLSGYDVVKRGTTFFTGLFFNFSFWLRVEDPTAGIEMSGQSKFSLWYFKIYGFFSWETYCDCCS